MLNKWLCLLIVFCLLAITPALVLAQNPDATVTPTLQQQGNESEQEEVTPTPTSTPTNTPVPPTATPTLTPLPATGTPTPTPTVTPIWPTDTPTRLPTTAATATPTNGPSCMDVREPNDQPGSGPTLTINQTVANLTLHPYGDIDYFMLWGKTGKYYDITTASSQGVDTRVKVFDPAGYLVAENDDFQTGNPASRASFQAPMEGWYYVSVDSRVPTAWECRQYTITAVDVSAPTATPTRAVTPGPPPTATPPPTAIPAEQMYDDYEPNYDFNTAANVGVGQTINLNFNPWPAGSQDIDNDYFKLYVKVGERLRIETIELAQGVDTNMILFRDNGQIVHGNDDCLEGQRASCIDWSPDYTGVAYIVIGPVGTIPEGIAAGSRAYSLMIKDTAGQPATPIAGGSINATPFASGTPQLGLPWAVTPLASTPVSIGATPLSLMVPFGTPTPMVQVRPIQPVGLPTPTLPPLQLITIDVKIFYDENNNRAPDASEGVSGISIRILDSTNNNLLGQTFTGSQGYAALTVTAVNEVRLSIPYLGYNEKISAPGQEVSIRLNPLRLPSLIP